MGLEWENLLGEDIYKEIDDSFCGQIKQKCQCEMQTEAMSRLYALYSQENLYYVSELPSINFQNFYRFFIHIAIKYAALDGASDFKICEETEKWIALNLVKAISKIPLRCLIKEINTCRRENLLSGDDKYAQYACYEEKFLKRPEYIKKICKKYPEMLRLLLLKIQQVVSEMIEIICAINADKQNIIDKILDNTGFDKIKNIDLGLSDMHTFGRTVAELALDNGKKVIYKPRKLVKEQLYQNIYDYISHKSGLESRNRKILNGDDYSWEEYVDLKECASKAEVKRYFHRMGIQLFICYILGASDIHGENLIANGEYPEFIDLEVMPGNVKESSGILTDKMMIQQFMQKSVMHTGILPDFVWGEKGSGVVISALHSDEKCMTPFKLPVISNAGTSEIELSYSCQEICLKGSILRYKGKAVPMYSYVEDINEGFQSAYFLAMDDGDEMKALFLPLFEMESRQLIRHTQQYDMYTNTSLAPDFLADIMDRIYLLHILKKRAGKDKFYHSLFCYELESMMNLEVPIYHFYGNSRSLFDGNGKEYPEYFSKTAKEIFEGKWENLSCVDLEHQIMLIRLSIEGRLLLPTDTVTYTAGEDRKIQKAITDEEKIQEITLQLLRLSISNGNKRIWLSLKFYERTWQIETAGMNLYDGLPGLAIFFAAISKKINTEEYRDICAAICRDMFLYTDEVLSGKRKSQSQKTGMFVGEGSLVFAYILLYQISREAVFLEYAKKYFVTGQNLADKDVDHDLLSGNAGWIIVLTKLYEITREEKYLDSAVMVGELLWEGVVKLPEGNGWKCAHQTIPLAGMAHGNSGFILAYAGLLKHKRNRGYISRIQKLLDYEDSLYSEKANNWLDLRESGNKGDGTNAWCHGGSGIVLSRLKLYQLPEFCKGSRVSIDLARGVECLRQWKAEKKVCICHGLAGKFLIMKSVNSILKLSDLEREMRELKSAMIQMNKIPVRELYNIAFMSGVMGIGIALCDLDFEFLM